MKNKRKDIAKFGAALIAFGALTALTSPLALIIGGGVVIAGTLFVPSKKQKAIES